MAIEASPAEARAISGKGAALAAPFDRIRRAGEHVIELTSSQDPKALVQIVSEGDSKITGCTFIPLKAE